MGLTSFKNKGTPATTTLEALRMIIIMLRRQARKNNLNLIFYFIKKCQRITKRTVESGAAGLPGQSVQRLVEITASPVQEHAHQGHKGMTVRDKAPELRDAIIPVQVNT